MKDMVMHMYGNGDPGQSSISCIAAVTVVIMERSVLLDQLAGPAGQANSKYRNPNDRNGLVGAFSFLASFHILCPSILGAVLHIRFENSGFFRA